jgi:ribosome-interacting GTPase 1
MGLLEKIKEIELEIARTQKNKATGGMLPDGWRKVGRYYCTCDHTNHATPYCM